MSHHIHLGHVSRRTVAVAAIIATLGAVTAIVAVSGPQSETRPGLGFEPPPVIVRFQAVRYEPQPFHEGAVADAQAARPAGYEPLGGLPAYATPGWRAPTLSVTGGASTYVPMGGLPDYAFPGWSPETLSDAGGTTGYEPMGGLPPYAQPAEVDDDLSPLEASSGR